MPKLRDPSAPHSRYGARGGNRRVTVLPAQCDLPAPKLPAGREWSREERRLWREIWASPQATQYDDSYALAVASYVIFTLAILDGSAPAWMAAEARRVGDDLGLTPGGMHRLGWVLPDPAPAPVVPLRPA